MRKPYTSNGMIFTSYNTQSMPNPPIIGDSRMSYQIVMNSAGVIETQPIDPNEEFVWGDRNLSNKKIIDYWIWAFSDLVGNTDRGNLAEYLVQVLFGLSLVLKSIHLF